MAGGSGLVDDWPDRATSYLEHAEMKQRICFIYVSDPVAEVANKFFQGSLLMNSRLSSTLIACLPGASRGHPMIPKSLGLDT